MNNVAVGKHPEKDKIGAITTTTDVSPTAHPHRQIWAIAGPAILANSSAPLVGLVDAWGIGHLPQAFHLAAVGLGSVIFSFLLWAFGLLRMRTCFRILFKCANLLAVVNNCTACATISNNRFYYQGNPVTALSKAILPALIASVLAGNVLAQEDTNQKCIDLEGAPPGLYATTDEGRTFLIKDGKSVEFGPGESGFANEGGVKCINKPPAFLEWPCATQAAQSRMFNTYRVEDLSQVNKLKEIVQRYFEVPEVLVPIAGYVDGEYNAVFNYNDLIQFSSPEYWYSPNPDKPILSGKRPKTLLVSLFVGTNQVVLDNNMIDVLRKELGSNELPVALVFNDSNTVPVSYFGANVSIEEIQKAFFERGIKLAEVPIWWQGDYQLRPTIAEFEKFFDIPPLEDIPPDKQEALKADLEAFGFTRKTIIVSLFAESGSMAVDQPERIRVAASIGIDRIPTTFNFVEEDMLVARCGPGTPISGATVSGSTTPVSGANVPPGAPVVPPAPAPPASDS